MQKSASILGITSILGGTLIQICSLMLGNWLGTLTAIFGFYLVFSGLETLKYGFDAAGQGALSLLRIGAVVMFCGSLADGVPVLGMFAPFLYFIAFVLELLGYIRLKSSATLGPGGKSGAGLLVTAMIIGLLFAILDIVPYLGDAIAGFTAIFIILLDFFGWQRIQEDLVRQHLS